MGMAILDGKVALEFGYESEADPNKRAFGAEWYKEILTPLDSDRLTTHPIRVCLGGGGDAGILEGLKVLRNREISEKKVIVKLG